MALLAQALPGIEPVIALITLPYSPLLRAGIFVVHALASLPQLRWLLLHYKAAVSSPSLRWLLFLLHWHHCRHPAGVFSPALASLP